MRAPLLLPGDAPGRLGLLLSQLEECRARTLSITEKIPANRLHHSSPAFPNSPAAHLAHLAAIDMDWIYCDMLGREMPAEVVAWLPFQDVRSPDGRLAQAEGVTLPQLVDLMACTRARLVEECLRLEEDGLSRLVDGLEGSATPEWILTHLAQHEAEHRGVLRRMVEFWKQRV